MVAGITFVPEKMKFNHFLYVPFTGLGLYNGFRGNHWLRNRIKVFKHFVIPSLLAQTDKDFTLWVSWRPQERMNNQVAELQDYLNELGINNIFTYNGLCFWDDKYPDKEAWDRLVNSLHGSLNVLFSHLDGNDILMTIQPSDDCYNKDMVREIKSEFSHSPLLQAVGYKHGYMANYNTKEIAEYNPKTNPPFFTIRFKHEDFIHPLEHMKYTGPYKSHEYIGDFLRYKVLDKRGFIVGTHGENISTNYKHPYMGKIVSGRNFADFGLENVLPLHIKLHFGKKMFRKLPHYWQRKLRYYLGEKLLNKLYNLGNR